MTVLSSNDEIFTRVRSRCEPALRESIESLPGSLRRMAGYHFGWWDRAGTATTGSQGKLLRPALVLAAAEACGGQPEQAIAAAVAMELVHNFSLIHDDMLDADATRRGRPTVWKIWGSADALLLGDALHALAIPLLARIPGAVLRMETAVIEMCRGQHEDCSFEVRPWVGVSEYVRMAAGKTGALMGCSCALGALSVGADDTVVAAMDRFGRELGLVFQFVDDLLGIWGDPVMTGKPVGSDLVRRKRSLPVVAALESDTVAAAELAAWYSRETPMTASDIARVTRLVEQAGGRDLAQQQADLRLRAAFELLPDLPEVADLIALADAVVHRDR